jgi:hypothetical protein
MKAHGCPGLLAGALLFMRGHAREAFQLTRPLLISCCQSLSTPAGNSRSPAPTRRQASGHIASKTWSRRNSSLCETSPASELGHWSAAIRSSSISGGMSLSVAISISPILFLAALRLGALDRYRSVGRHKKAHSPQSLCKAHGTELPLPMRAAGNNSTDPH